MNEIAKIQLFRIAASMPWAEVETTQHNIRITYYEGDQADAHRFALVLSKDEAADLSKALKILVDNYCAKEKEEEE